MDYQGFIKPRSRSEVVDDNDRCLSLQFMWRPSKEAEWEKKPVTTLFIGTSPGRMINSSARRRLAQWESENNQRRFYLA